MALFHKQWELILFCPHCCQTRTVTSSPHQKLQHSRNTSCHRSCGSHGAEPGRETRFHLSHGMQEGSSFFTKQRDDQYTKKQSANSGVRNEMGNNDPAVVSALIHDMGSMRHTSVFFTSPLVRPHNPVLRDATKSHPPADTSSRPYPDWLF